MRNNIIEAQMKITQQFEAKWESVNQYVTERVRKLESE